MFWGKRISRKGAKWKNENLFMLRDGALGKLRDDQPTTAAGASAPKSKFPFAPLREILLDDCPGLHAPAWREGGCELDHDRA